MERNQYTIGLIIIIAGAAILLGKMGFFENIAALLWPLFILIPGLLLHVLYFGRLLPSGVLIPGGILVTYSLMFFFCNIAGWEHMSYLWPGFIFGVAVGLYEFSLFEREQSKGALTASIVLAAVSAVFFTFMLLFSSAIYVIAVLLIAAGAYMMYRRPRSW